MYEVINIANKHPRVYILTPGPGVGDYPDLVNVILPARNVKDTMPDFVISRIADIMKKNNIKDIRKVGLYGIAYKENVDDMRESPTLQLLEKLESHLSYGMKSYDPFIKTKVMEGQVLDFNDFIEQVELVVVMVGMTISIRI